MNKKIAIIGGGNIGASIAKGLIADKFFAPSDIYITRRRIKLLKDCKDLGCNILSDNKKAIEASDIVFLTLKPHHFEEVMKEIQPILKEKKHILISTITGTKLSDIETYTGKTPIFLAMPNTAISIQESMTCIASKHASEKQKDEIVEIFNQLGKGIIINEELMGAATVLCACGIAYALRFIRAATQGGIEIGFGAELAQLLASQTVKGATELVLDSGNHPEKEIDKVTTPLGVTISGLNQMEHKGFSSALIQGLLTSFNKVNDLEKK